MKHLFSLNPVPSGASPFVASGTLSGAVAEITTDEGEAIKEAGVQIGGNNTSGSDKVATGSLYLPYFGFDNYLIKAWIKSTLADAGFEYATLDHYFWDGTDRVIMSVRLNSAEGATKAFEYLNASEAFVAASSITNWMGNPYWTLLEYKVKLSTQEYTYINWQGQAQTGVTGRTEAIANEPGILLQAHYAMPTGNNGHLVIGSYDLWGE